MKKKLIATVAALGILSSGFTFADSELALSVFDNQTVIDGHVFENARLQYPFLINDNHIYMPLDYQTLRTLGYLSTWDDNQNAFRIYTSTNKTFNISTSEVKWSEAPISSAVSNADLSWMDSETVSNCLIEANGILYMGLTPEVLEKLDWAAAFHPYLGLQMSVESGSADAVSFDTSEVAYYDALSRFMMTRNNQLSYEKASEFVKYVREASVENDIDEIWIMAMLWQESWYDEKCEYKGAIGLMQIMESTGRALGLNKEQLFDPKLSIQYGVKYLKDQMNAFDNNIELATLAYNQGPVRVKKGTYKTWYLEDIKEKSSKIKNWLDDQDVEIFEETVENVESTDAVSDVIITD